MAGGKKADVVELTDAEADLLENVWDADGDLPYEENKGEALDGLIAYSLVDVIDGRTLSVTEAGEAAAKGGKVAERQAEKAEPPVVDDKKEKKPHKEG